MAVQLNGKAVAYITAQINAGNVNRDAEWGASEPTPESEDAFLTASSFDA